MHGDQTEIFHSKSRPQVLHILKQYELDCTEFELHLQEVKFILICFFKIILPQARQNNR